MPPEIAKMFSKGGQGTLFDLGKGKSLRDQGEEQALTAADEAWRVHFEMVVERLADSKRPFTSDDVVQVTGLPHRSSANRNNAVGALMAAMAHRGVIVKTGRIVQARRVLSHARELREWIGASVHGEE